MNFPWAQPENPGQAKMTEEERNLRLALQAKLQAETRQMLREIRLSMEAIGYREQPTFAREILTNFERQHPERAVNHP